jgi:hypothetical protein
MSPIIMSGIMLISLIACCGFFIIIEKQRSRRRLRNFLKHFSITGSKLGLSFSSQALLKNAVIGLDGMKRKLLIIYDLGNGLYNQYLVNLDEVNAVNAEIISMDVGQAGAYEMYEVKKVSAVVLSFNFLSEKEILKIYFYNEEENDPVEVPELEQKARDWESILNKMLLHRYVDLPSLKIMNGN